MRMKIAVLTLSFIICTFLLADVSLIAADKMFDDEITLSDLQKFEPTSSEELADALRMDVDTLESIENVYLVNANGETELVFSIKTEENEEGIAPYKWPFSGNFPTIPGLTYYWVESEWSHTYIHFPTFDTPSLIPRTRFASGDDTFVMFNLNGTWCSFVGNPSVGWETGIHNPIDQTNDLDIQAFWIDTFDNVITVNSLYKKEQEEIHPSNYKYVDKYADFFTISGQDLYIYELSPVFYYAGYYRCDWDSIGEASYFPPSTFYEHIVRVIL